MLWQGLWKQRIRYKLGDERKRKEQENETVQQRKRVKTSTAVNDTDVPEGSKQQESPQGTGTYGLPNYSPAMPHGEDNETMEGHVKWLQRAVKIRRKEDEKKVELLIKRTLHKTLFDGDTTMEIFFDTFPFMKNEREIIEEFKRNLDHYLLEICVIHPFTRTCVSVLKYEVMTVCEILLL